MFLSHITQVVMIVKVYDLSEENSNRKKHFLKNCCFLRSRENDRGILMVNDRPFEFMHPKNVRFWDRGNFRY